MLFIRSILVFEYFNPSLATPVFIESFDDGTMNNKTITTTTIGACTHTHTHTHTPIQQHTTTYNDNIKQHIVTSYNNNNNNNNNNANNNTKQTKHSNKTQ